VSIYIYIYIPVHSAVAFSSCSTELRTLSGSLSKSNDDDNDDDAYLKKISTTVLQNRILHRNADQPKAYVRESTYKYLKDTDITEQSNYRR
jgi:GTP-sensing pleiotropic transcriptional regulator CodY